MIACHKPWNWLSFESSLRNILRSTAQATWTYDEALVVIHFIATHPRPPIKKVTVEQRRRGVMDWVGMREEIVEVLENPLICDPHEAILCVDEILARYSRRGNSLSLAFAEWEATKSKWPKYFTWDW